MTVIRFGVTALSCAMITTLAFAEQGKRQIEEIVVTAEKRESTVSDTSISITAFGEDMIEDFGIQGADELVNFIPATTRDAYDIRIRGVGRNFRALGGDPGVATYYNGVYSEDFGIAASENGLYDVARIEALRGPQGTLYGRNSIGGALNYITNRPTQEFEAEFRTLFGGMGTQEFYGIMSGPLIQDKLAVRAVGVERDRDGSTTGMRGSEDINSIHDSNYSLSLEWNINDNWNAFLRYNDRASDRIIGQGVVTNEGPQPLRGVVETHNYARGFVPTTAGASGAIEFTHPVTGASVYGRPVIAGVESAAAANPAPAFGLGGMGLSVSPDLEDISDRVATNSDNSEKFVQNAIQFELAWDINERTTLKYLGGWMDFDYTFDIDLDYTDAEWNQPRQTVLEAVETYSHELQLLWSLGDNLELTSGLYFFHSNRLQNYAFRNNESQGRYREAANYGNLAPFVGFAGGHKRRNSAAVGSSNFGLWEGAFDGTTYEYWNKVETDALAAYTQGTYTFNEEWALTVGVRWAEDKKSAAESRTGYFEANFGFLSPFLQGACDAAIGSLASTTCANLGLTDLAIANIFMGNATPTFDPTNPIAPTCALTDPNCATPLRLGGVPFSFSDRTAGDDDWGDTSFRVNLDWTPNEDTLVYASVTTGYRAGGYSLGIGDSRGPGNFAGVVPLAYDQEEVVAYEIGYKSTLLDGQMQVNSSIYMYSYDNYQDRVEIFNAASNTSLDQVQNAEEAENMGVEVEVMWLATDNLTIGGNASYTTTEYKSDFFVLEDDNPAYPVSVFGVQPFLVHNLKGNQLKRIPEWKATAWASYEWTFERGSLSAGSTWSYTGEYYDSGIERALDEVPERHRVDVSLTWRDSRDQWNVRAFVDNVFNESNARGIGTATEASNFRQTAAVLYPRFAGVEATFRFGAL